MKYNQNSAITGLYAGIAKRCAASLLALVGLFAGGVQSAHALPSFARQTGLDCAVCHVGAYGPQLTPMGVRFKIGGYTDTDGKDGKIPLSGMLVGAFTHTRKKQDVAPTVRADRNNTAPDEASLSVASCLAENLGAFIQWTYDGTEHHSVLDHVNVVRAARTFDCSTQPDRLSGGLQNHHYNVGVNASYQFLGTRTHVGTIYTSYIHESQMRNDLFIKGEATNRTSHLNEFRINSSYYFDQTCGVTAGRFINRGSRDTQLYANGSPNTTGSILQADRAPFDREDSWARRGPT